MKVLRAAVVLGVSTPLVVLACGSDDNVATRGSDGGAAGEGGETVATGGKGGTAGTAGTPAGGGVPSEGGTGAVDTGGAGGEPNGGAGGVPVEPEPACGDAEVNGDLVCFAEPKTITGYEGVPTDVAIGDWDGAGQLDVIATTQGGLAYASLDDSGALGDTTVLNQVGLVLGSGQLDSGADLDLLLGPVNQGVTTVAFGDGAGDLGPTTTEGFGAEGTLYNFFVGDVAGSGPSQDIVVTFSNSISLVTTNGTEGANFVGHTSYRYPTPQDGVLAKLGSSQWLVYSTGTDLVRHQVTYELGATSLGEPLSTPIGGTASQLDVGDFNEDGFDDVAVTLSGSNTLSVAFGDGTGAGDFAVVSDPDQFSSLSLGDSPDAKSQRDVKVGDFNGDGHADLAVSVLALDAVAIFSGDGEGGFTQPTLVSTGENTGPTRLAVGDLNDDGVDDLAVIGSTSSSLIVIVSDP